MTYRNSLCPRRQPSFPNVTYCIQWPKQCTKYQEAWWLLHTMIWAMHKRSRSFVQACPIAPARQAVSACQAPVVAIDRITTWKMLGMDLQSPNASIECKSWSERQHSHRPDLESITICERCHIQKISVRYVPIPHTKIHSKWSSMPRLRNGQQRIPDIRPNSDFHQYGHLSSAGKPQHVRGLSIRQWLCQIRLPYMRAERWWVQQLSAKWSCLLQSSVLATQASA